MIVKLKTLEQLEEEFGFEYDGCDYTTTFNGMFWLINDLMFEQLGKEIEVEKRKSWYYTHYDNNIGYWWNELWFEPEFVSIEFINEDEFEI